MVKDRKRIALVALPLLAVLILALILLLAGGTQEEEDDEPIPSSTAVETTPPPITPEDAATNLSVANNFRLTISMLNSADTYSYENAYCFQMAKAPNGSQTILFSQHTVMISNGETVETVGDQAFYQDRTAYIQYEYGTSPVTAMWNQDGVYDLASVVEEQSGLPLQAVGKSMIKAFSALSPVLTSSPDGSNCYLLLNLKPDQFGTVYRTFAGEAATQELLQSAGENCMFNIKANIDSQDFLTQFKLEMLNVSSNNGSQNITICFSIDNINTAGSIALPEYVENFSLKNNTEVVCSTKGVDAHYIYREASGDQENAGLHFTGFGDVYGNGDIVECYEVLSEINGTPVTEVESIVYNPNCTVALQYLVIPTGVTVNIQGIYTNNVFETHTKDTVLFFNDKEEDVEKTFLLEGEITDSKEAVVFKAAYYAGQWEYVNGVPTPNN